MTSLDCGCDTRRSTIGSSAWWSGVTLTGGVLFLLLVKGGPVTNKTKKVLAVAAAGAMVAVLSDQIIRPTLGVK